MLVLKHMSRPRDILNCSMVSKAWADAISHTYPHQVELQHHDDLSQEFKHSVHQVRWLQGLHQQGRLQGLKKAETLDFAWDEPQRANPSALSQGLVVIAGSCNLQVCKLDGRFDITFAVAVLPTTLVSMDLWPISGPHTICMSSFQRFGKLRTLRLGLGHSDTPEEHFETLEMFLLDAIVPSIEQLEVHASLHTSILATCDIVTCLPNVNVLILAVKASQVGLRLAHQIMEMQLLRELELYLYDGDGQDTTLVVPQASLLEQLDLTAPSDPRLSVKFDKPGVNYVCCHTYSITSGNTFGPIGIVV